MDLSKKTKAEIIVAIVLLIAAYGVLFHLNDDSPDVWNVGLRVIVTDSMDADPQPYDIQSMPEGSLIVYHKVSQDEISSLKVGDVIGFTTAIASEPVFHRIVLIDTEKGVIITKGDAMNVTDTVPFGNVYGKVTLVSETAGDVVLFVKANIVFILVVFAILMVMAYALRYIFGNVRDKESEVSQVTTFSS